MGKGIIRVPLRVLEEAWKLGPNTKILRIRQTWKSELNGEAEIIVQSPDLPEEYDLERSKKL